MALAHFKAPLYLLAGAAVTGLFVKTALGTRSESDSSKTETSHSAPKSPAKPVARTGPQPQPATNPPPGAGGPPDPFDAAAFVRRDFFCPSNAPCPSPRLESFDVVIASLPDPATSGFVEEFDNGIDALEQAAQTQDYTVDRHWLPWSRDGATMTDRADARRAGWILFRKEVQDARYRGLLVLVVGERLGSGIQPAMLDDAIKVKRALIGRGRPAFVLGPYFSGTAASLRDGLERSCGSTEDPAKPPPTGGCESTTIISGTATRPLNAAILTDTKRLAVTFQATVNPDALLSAGMHEFLHHSLGIEDAHIAELTEMSTAFGVGHADNQELVDHGGSRPLRVSIPLHLPNRSSPCTDAKPSPARSGDAEVSVDETPLLTCQALSEADQMLASTIEALRRQDITDVGILATSSEEKIALVTALRAGAADIRPHVYEANQALADLRQHEAMDGTLVASSYPLAPVTQIWSARPEVRDFTSDAAEGTYNALLALLWQARAIDGDDLRRALRDYAFPFGPDRPSGPPVWISVIVGGQVWPLAAYRSDLHQSEQYVFGRQPNAPGQAAGPEVAVLASTATGYGSTASLLVRSGFATLTLFGLLAFVLGNLLSLARAFPSLRRCPFLLHYDPAPGAPSNDERRRQRLFFWDRLRDADSRPSILLGTWVVAVSGLAAACFYEFPLLLERDRAFKVDSLVGDLLGAVLFVSSALLLLSPLASTPAPPADGSQPTRWKAFIRSGHWSHRPLQVLLIAAFGASASTAVFRFTHLGTRSDGRAFFFFARLMHPGLGLTPVLPIAIMATVLYCACVFRLRVVRRTQRLKEEAAQWHGDSLFEASQRLSAFSESALRSLSHILWMGTSVGLAMFLWPRIRPRSLEGWNFDLLVALGFGLTFAVAGASIWRANRLWQMLALFLRALSDHPWAPAFKTIPTHLSLAFQTPMPGRLDSREVAASCEMTAHLAAENPLPAPATGEPAPQAPAAVGSTDLISQYLAALAPIWNAPGVRPPALSGSGEGQTSPAVRLREHYLALRMTEALSYMCDATRATLFVGSAAAVAAVLATSAYPFQPAGTLAWAARISIIIVVLVAVRVIAGIERDQILSWIAKTDPGKVTPSWSLAVRFAGYVLLPLGSLIAAHLPDHGLLIGILHSFSTSLEH